MRWINRALAATGMAAGAYLGVSALMARGLTRSTRTSPEDTPSSVGLAYETIKFPSRDGSAELSGWLIPPPDVADMRDAMGHRWIVMLHGHGSNRADSASGSLALVRDLHRRGFGMLLFDMRGSGDSSGGHSSAGFYERFDLLGAIDQLVELGARRERIGALGQSLGGAVALMVSANPGSVGAVVADSAFADLWMMINRSQEGPVKALAALNPGMSLMARLLYGIDIGEVSPARSIAVSDTPALVIHGEDDTLVPPEHARLLATGEIERASTALWIVPGAEHLQAYRTAPGEYVDRVTKFFEANLPA
jgi:dipeptidyl aminopeptidase/acylaminoacyl peptidase